MSGINKYDEKTKRQQRRRNHVAHDLGSAKYRPRVVERKRIEDEETGTYFFADRYHEDEVDY